MDKFAMFLLLLIGLYFLDKKFREYIQKRKKQKFESFLTTKRKEIIDIYQKHGKQKAVQIISKEAHELINIPFECSQKNQFQKVLQFIDNIGDNYSDEDTFKMIFYGEYQKEDREEFAKILLEEILNPAV